MNARPERVAHAEDAIDARVSCPLPELVSGLRGALYSRLVPVANRWNEAMGIETRFPESHAEFLERCHVAGQSAPTPLLLQYGVDDYPKATPWCSPCTTGPCPAREAPIE